MSSVPFVLRDHREQLWRRWAESLGDDVAADYRELMSSPLGERFVRAFVDDLIAWSEAEEYEAPGQLRQACERVAADAAYRLSLGFTALDLAMALQALRGAIVDVLLDALVLGELPSFAETLEQLKAADAFIDRLVAAVLAAAPARRRLTVRRAAARRRPPAGLRPLRGATRLSGMLRLALIFGGRSAEHEISLASARFVHSMLDRDKYDVVPVGITPAGRWVVPEDFDAATTEGLDAAAVAGRRTSSPTPRAPASSSPTGRSTRSTSPSPSCTAPSPRTAPSRASSRWPGWPTPGPACWAARSAWTRSS